MDKQRRKVKRKGRTALGYRVETVSFQVPEESILAAEGSVSLNNTSFTPVRVTIALVLSFLGCIFIWFATPYNNFILRTGFISDDYLPASVLALLLLLVLVINPILMRIRRSWSFDHKQIILMVGVAFIAASIASTGLLRALPYSLARQVRDASEWKETAGYYEKADLPASLFPGKLGFHEDVEVVRQFLVKLPEGQSIPWEVWIWPSIGWLCFFLSFWMFCISLAGIMLPQWQQNERIAFPLTRILQSLMEPPEDRRRLPPIFYEGKFWIAALVVLLVHSLVGLNTYFPSRIPAYLTTWNLTPLFTEEPLSYMPAYMKSGQFYFIFIGVAYFMSTRVSFSIWFFMLAYALYTMICQTYIPPFFSTAPDAHRSGALLTVTITILWLGRARWFHVLRCAIGNTHSEEDRRDRNFVFMFLLGAFGMFGWLVWAGVQVSWAILLIAIIFVYQLVVSRIVAETGLPVVGLTSNHFLHYFSLVPIRLVNGASAWFLGALSEFIGTGSRTSLAALTMQSMSLDEKVRPRHQWKTARLYVIVLILGFFVCGAAHLYFSYNHSQTLDSNPETPVSSFGTYRLHSAVALLRQHVNEEWDKQSYNRPAHMAFGAVLAGGLQYASLTMPKWPLHPVGLLLVYTWFGQTVWMSVAFGWLLRVVLILFGGARMYRKLRPLFIGLIIGEILAAIVWFSVSGILTLFGYPYKIVPILPF